MENGTRKSAVGMMLVVGGLAAAVPAVSVATPVPTPNGKTAIVQCNGKSQHAKTGIVQCNGKPQGTTAIQDNSKPVGTLDKNKGFFCNMKPQTGAQDTAAIQDNSKPAQPLHKNKGFYCNMKPKTAPNAKTVVQAQTQQN